MQMTSNPISLCHYVIIYIFWLVNKVLHIITVEINIQIETEVVKVRGDVFHDSLSNLFWVSLKNMLSHSSLIQPFLYSDGIKVVY